MRNVSRLRQEPMIAFGVPVLGGAVVPMTGQAWWVDPNAAIYTPKRGFGHGKSEDYPRQTLEETLALVNTGDVVFIQGNIREEGLICSNLKFDVKVVGIGMPHHPDQPSSAYHPGSGSIRPPSSPTATTPLLEVRGRGWSFHNILFDCPVDAAAIKLVTNSDSGTDEYSAGHALIEDCRFDAGLIGIEDNGGAGFVRIRRNLFRGLTESGGAGIKCTSTSNAVPLAYRIEDNHFHNNASHILCSMSYSSILRNIFGRFTATLSVDIDDQPSANQGEYNVITQNYLSGTYGATAYPPGSNNEWAGNFNSLSGGVTAIDPS